MKTQTKAKGPMEALTPEEIISALNASGYPLEIRLLTAFADGGMDPIIGFRVEDEAGGSREIDIIASFSRHVPVGEAGVIRITLRLIIEAKNLGPVGAFVGLPWRRPTDHELRVARLYFGGRPSNRVVPGLERDGAAIIGPGGLAEAFDTMNAAPVCSQWAVVRRTKAGGEQRPFADHEQAFWDDIDGVVRASHTLMAGLATHHPWPQKQFAMIFEMPVVIVATENLWLMDAASSTAEPLSPAPSLMLARMFEAGGRVHYRLVDVVCESGVPDFIARCQSTIDNLEGRARAQADALLELADRQREPLTERLFDKHMGVR